MQGIMAAGGVGAVRGTLSISTDELAFIASCSGARALVIDTAATLERLLPDLPVRRGWAQARGAACRQAGALPGPPLQQRHTRLHACRLRGVHAARRTAAAWRSCCGASRRRRRWSAAPPRCRRCHLTS